MKGSVIVYSGNDKVSVKESPAPGINEKILLLLVDVEENPGPMKGHPLEYKFKKVEDENHWYDQVQVVYNNSKSYIADVVDVE